MLVIRVGVFAHGPLVAALDCSSEVETNESAFDGRLTSRGTHDVLDVFL